MWHAKVSVTATISGPNVRVYTKVTASTQDIVLVPRGELYPTRTQPQEPLQESLRKAVRNANASMLNYHTRNRLIVFPPGLSLEEATDKAEALLSAGLQGLTQIMLLPRNIPDCVLFSETQAIAAMIEARDVWLLRRPCLPQPQTDLASQASTALEPEEQEADTSNPDPEMSDPEPDWLIDSDEEFAIALDIENES